MSVQYIEKNLHSSRKIEVARPIFVCGCLILSRQSSIRLAQSDANFYIFSNDETHCDVLSDINACSSL